LRAKQWVEVLLRALSISLVTLAIVTGASVRAQIPTLSGLCLDLRVAGCTERFLPFDGLTIDLCEETCTLTNPVTVRALEGTLYDRVCLSDSPTDMEGRVLLLRQTDRAGQSRLLLIDHREILAIVPCPR
jgi:hypothetical protein